MTTQTIVLELSNDKATRNISNSEFICNFNPININKGDIVTINKVIISSKSSDVYGTPSIFIEQDKSILFNFVLWEHDSGFDSDLAGTRVNSGDKDTYWNNRYGYNIMIDTQTRKPVIYGKNITIKAGSYTPTSLAATITDLMTKSDMTNTLYNKPFNAISPSIIQVGTYQSDITGKPLWYCKFDFARVINGNIMQGTTESFTYYLYENPVYFDLLSCQDIQLGAMQWSLIFDETENQFKITNMHTPYVNDSKQAIVITQYIDDVLNIQCGVASSGIWLTNISDAAFFQNILNININDICINFNDEQTEITNWDNFDKFTCYQRYEIVMNRDNASRAYEDAFKDTDYTHLSQTTNELKGGQYQITSQTPYYIIELISNFNWNIYDNSDKSNSFYVSACIAKSYMNANTIIGGQEDAFTYTADRDFILSSFLCRILGPDKTPCVDNAGNNIVILQITKATTIENEQPSK